MSADLPYLYKDRFEWPYKKLSGLINLHLLNMVKISKIIGRISYKFPYVTSRVINLDY